jgi:hypothetical protein
LINLGFKIYDQDEYEIDIDNDSNPDGYIFKIPNDFKLKKGDILAREGHVHIYLGDGTSQKAENFGWGRVYRNYPQFYSIYPVQSEDGNYVALVNSMGEIEHYPRVYRFKESR